MIFVHFDPSPAAACGASSGGRARSHAFLRCKQVAMLARLQLAMADAYDFEAEEAAEVGRGDDAADAAGGTAAVGAT